MAEKVMSEKNGEIAKNVTTYWWSLSDGERKQLEHCIKKALDAKDSFYEAKLAEVEAVLEKVWLAVEQASRLRCSCHMGEKCLYCKAKQSIQTYREGK